MRFVKISGRKVCSFFLMTKFRRVFFYILCDYVVFSQFFGAFRSRESGAKSSLSLCSQQCALRSDGVLRLFSVGVFAQPGVFVGSEVWCKAGADVAVVVVEPCELTCCHQLGHDASRIDGTEGEVVEAKEVAKLSFS